MGPAHELGTNRLVIVGAGGHARELLDIVEAVNAAKPTWNFLGFVADGERRPDLAEQRGASILGGVELLSELQTSYVIGVGSSAERARLSRNLSGCGEAAVLVHPSVVVGSQVRLSPGCCIAAGVVITTNVQLGDHTHVNVAASISHDTVVGRWCTIGPGSRVAGWVELGDGVDVGIGAVFRDRVRVGPWTVVGAGAAVVGDLPGHVTAAGVPARPLSRKRRPSAPDEGAGVGAG